MTASLEALVLNALELEDDIMSAGLSLEEGIVLFEEAMDEEKTDAADAMAD